MQSVYLLCSVVSVNVLTKDTHILEFHCCPKIGMF